MVSKKDKQGRLDSEFLFFLKGGAVEQWSCALSLILHCFNKMLIGQLARQEVEAG